MPCYHIDIVLVGASTEQDKEVSILQNKRHVGMSTVRIWEVRLSSTYENITSLKIGWNRKLSFICKLLARTNDFQKKGAFSTYFSPEENLDGNSL